MKIRIIKGIFGILCLMAVSLTALAANPYDYNRWKNNINDANWQVGYDSYTVCKADDGDCEDALDDSDWEDYMWANAYNLVRFTTESSEDTGWRNELRYADSFWRNTNKSMTTRLRFWSGTTTSSGFTVAQLHNENGDGPPARLEIIDESYYQVKWRTDPDCDGDEDDDCFFERLFSANPSNWQSIQLSTGSGYINVTVNGQTRSYYMQGGGWPAEQAYYWKTGIYLQDDGHVDTAVRYVYW